MKFDITKVSGDREDKPTEKATKTGNKNSWDAYWEIEVTTLEELIALSKKEGDRLIVGEKTIIIYDDYLE